VKIRDTSAGGVVVRDGEVLVLRRKTGEWVMPKGKLEPGELIGHGLRILCGPSDQRHYLPQDRWRFKTRLAVPPRWPPPLPALALA